MTRRRAIAAEELFETADRLRSEGKEVTATALLEALGGGSLTTIYKLLEEWERQHPVEIKIVSSEIPPEVMAGYLASWKLVTQVAERSLKEGREKSEREIEAASKKFQDALDYSVRLEAELESQGQEIDDLKGQLAEWERLAHESRAECAGHKAAAEQLQLAVEKQEKELQRNEEEQKSLQTARDQAVREAAELRGQVSSLKEQYAQLLTALSGGADKKKA